MRSLAATCSGARPCRLHVRPRAIERGLLLSELAFGDLYAFLRLPRLSLGRIDLRAVALGGSDGGIVLLL